MFRYVGRRLRPLAGVLLWVGGPFALATTPLRAMPVDAVARQAKLEPSRRVLLNVIHTRLELMPQSKPAQPKPAKPKTAQPPAKGAQPTQPTCAPVAGKLPMQLALRHYVKNALPKPMRFLTAVGTDSAISDNDAKVLQEFGPIYYYAGSDAAKQKVRERMEAVGPFPALLVVQHKGKKVSATVETVRLGGHYITGEFDGKRAASREYTFACSSAGWQLQGTKEEKSS